MHFGAPQFYNTDTNCGNGVGGGIDKEKKVENGQMGQGREVGPKTEQVKKNVKLWETQVFLKTQGD